MSRPTQKSLKELARLRDLRVRAAHRQVQEREQEMNRAQEAVVRREQSVHVLDVSRDALTDYLSGEGAAQVGRVIGMVAARHELLSDRLEDEQAHLQRERVALVEAVCELDQAQLQLRERQQQQEMVKELIADERKTRFRELESKAELDADGLSKPMQR